MVTARLPERVNHVERAPWALDTKVTEELSDIVREAEPGSKEEETGAWYYTMPLPGVKVYGFTEEALRQF